jgi:hypothetical protein
VDDFMRLAGHPSYRLEALLDAAQIEHSEQPSHEELRAAVHTLGVKASSLVIGINAVCKGSLNTGPSNKIWTQLFREMMSDIEIGYHLGLSVEHLGHERGMLVGFSRFAGLTLLIAHRPKMFGEWFSRTGGTSSPIESVKFFGCEPYQVSALLMQHLGLGPEVALATACVHGGGESLFGESKSLISGWRAAHDWIRALKTGLRYPEEESSRTFFPELRGEHSHERLPVHLQPLFDEVDRVRETQSSWTWHLPLPSYEETAEAIVYRINSNSSGSAWTKTLALDPK